MKLNIHWPSTPTNDNVVAHNDQSDYHSIWPVLIDLCIPPWDYRFYYRLTYGMKPHPMIDIPPQFLQNS